MPRKRWLPCAIAAGLGAAFVIGTFHPGLVDSDSLDQLTQARTHHFNDWHPVAMSWVWAWLDRVVPGPLLPLILQNLLFWGGLALAGVACFGEWPGALVVLVVGLWPPMIPYLGNVMKDTQMTAALMGAFGLIAWSLNVRRSWLISAAAFLCLLYASAVRHNGPLVAAPLALLVPPRAQRWLAIPIVAACLCIGPLATRLLNADQAHVERAVFLYDLAGLSLVEGTDLIPAAFEEPGRFSMERLRELYRNDSIDLLAWPRTPGTHLIPSADPEEGSRLSGLWLHAIARHPFSYLRHRGQLFLSLLGLHPLSGPFFPSWTDPNELGVALPPSAWRSQVFQALGVICRSFLLNGWLYLAVSVTAAGVSLRRSSSRRSFSDVRPLVLGLSISSLANALPYAVVGTAHDFRFLLWSMEAGLLASAILVVRRPFAPLAA